MNTYLGNLIQFENETDYRIPLTRDYMISTVLVDGTKMMITESTRDGNVLDYYFTNHPTFNQFWLSARRESDGKWTMRFPMFHSFPTIPGGVWDAAMEQFQLLDIRSQASLTKD